MPRKKFDWNWNTFRRRFFRRRVEWRKAETVPVWKRILRVVAFCFAFLGLLAVIALLIGGFVGVHFTTAAKIAASEQTYEVVSTCTLIEAETGRRFIAVDCLLREGTEMLSTPAASIAWAVVLFLIYSYAVFQSGRLYERNL